ncbi:hypothetical protein AMEX_G7002 [Astyanax mexicanus]|uniref:Uncharacterized protein n=1 Tax=Astyanax mexicanus TaxID=7994 RepID=A0A8T2M016_ASTMX|nr:hypothetical protein AMEX_G7002 [Astyanax mexicanus]
MTCFFLHTETTSHDASRTISVRQQCQRIKAAIQCKQGKVRLHGRDPLTRPYVTKGLFTVSSAVGTDNTDELLLLN